MKFKVYFPVTHNMSPIWYVVRETAMETKEEQALWHYNKSREHDGYRPIDYLPRGTKFVRIED